MNANKLRCSLMVGLIFITFVFRLMGLGMFMTADEPNWMIRSAEFWHKLVVNHDAGGTFITTHPGVTAMWLIGAGEFWQEERLGLAVDTSTLSHFRSAATVPIALTTSLLVGLITYLVMRMWGIWPGALAGFLLALDPYLLGMSQIAHLDALLALFLISAVCSFLVGIKHKSPFFIFGAGILAGLAAGTKLLPSLVFLPWVALVSFCIPTSSWSGRLRSTIRYTGIILGMAGLTIYAIWPALWVKGDIGKSFSHDTAIVATVVHSEVVDEGGQDTIAPASFYLRTLAGRATPFVLILCVGAAWLIFRVAVRSRTNDFFITQLSITWICVFVVAFLIMVSLAAKKSDRYALPALTALPLIAAWICAGAWRMILAKRPYLIRPFRIAGCVIAILLIVQTFLVMPYAIAYNAPWFSGRPLPQQGWGEGLDAAATWLNAHPLGDKLAVASWYPNVLATYFSGTTYSLSSRNDPRVGYVVLYRNMLGRGSDEAATNIWDEYSDRVPAKVISIGELPYVWIFETFGIPYFPKNTGELLPGMEVGQLVPVVGDTFEAIDIGLSTFSGRAKKADVVLHIREDIEATEDIRTVTKSSTDIADSDWNTFRFAPVNDTRGKTYYVALTTSLGTEGDAVTIRYTDDDIKEGQMVWRRKQLSPMEKQHSFLKPGDIAYRLVR